MSSVATGTDKATYRHFIAGEWVDAAGGATFDDLNPYTGEVVATVAAGAREDARRAVEAAAEAFPTWSQSLPAERQRVFLAAADILERRTDEVVGLLARETGCTFGFGMFQMMFVPGLLRQAAGMAYRPIGEVIPSDVPGAFAMGIRRPVGVVGAIAPWNAALILSARSIAAPLVLGNTVVAKPSEESPFVGGLLWGEIFQEAGLPDGALNVVAHGPGQAGPIAEAFVGGLADKTAGLKAGDPAEHDTIIGPLINERAMETVAGRVQDAVSRGARVLAGGDRVGRCYQATLLADVPPDSELARLETFGPVASVEVVTDAEAAVRRANDTPYGLAAGILTSDPDRGLALADQLQSGIVHVNDQPVGDEPQMPFGGVKDSGWGRFGGAAATDEFTELKWVTVQSGTRPFPF